MKCRVVLMIALILAHANMVWAVEAYASPCSTNSTSPHAQMTGHQNAHSMMSHEAEAPATMDCCEDMDELSCQLHCFAAASCLARAEFHFITSAPQAASIVAAVGQRSPPYRLSLLRPPQVRS